VLILADTPQVNHCHRIFVYVGELCHQNLDSSLLSTSRRRYYQPVVPKDNLRGHYLYCRLPSRIPHPFLLRVQTLLLVLDVGRLCLDDYKQGQIRMLQRGGHYYIFLRYQCCSGLYRVWFAYDSVLETAYPTETKDCIGRHILPWPFVSIKCSYVE
jgi:hypothetical protein